MILGIQPYLFLFLSSSGPSTDSVEILNECLTARNPGNVVMLKPGSLFRGGRKESQSSLGVLPF